MKVSLLLKYFIYTSPTDPIMIEIETHKSSRNQSFSFYRKISIEAKVLSVWESRKNQKLINYKTFSVQRKTDQQRH